MNIPWPEGLHLRPAGMLVRLAQRFRSSIRLHANGRMADARSVLAILLLCAAAQTQLVVEVQGDDEDPAIQAVTDLFSRGFIGEAGGGGPRRGERTDPGG